METTPVTGVGSVPINGEERTSNKIVDEYMAAMKQIQAIFDKVPLTANDYHALQKAMQALKKLAKEGDSTTTPGMIYYMPKDMLAKLNTIFAMLNAVGISADQNVDDQTALIQMDWLQNHYKDTQVGSDGKEHEITFQTLLSGAVDGLTGATRSLQSMLYTYFVLATIAKFTEDLASLEEQLKITKKITDVLAELQDFRNSSIADPANPGWNDGNPVAPTLVLAPDSVQKLSNYRDQLQSLLQELKGQGATEEETDSLAQALTEVQKDINLTLAYADKKVKTDPSFPPQQANQTDAEWRKTWSPKNWEDYTTYSQFAGGPTAGATPEEKQGVLNVRAWFLDYHGSTTGNAGSVSSNLSKAITATISLNDVQKEELRTVNYVHEQFMKMATTLMQLITKLIEKPAAAIKQ